MHFLHVFAACLVIAAATNAAEPKKPALHRAVAVVPTRVVLYEQKETAELTMKVKAETIVNLAGSPTTGFAWVVAKAGDAEVVSVGEPVYEKGKSNLAATGVGGTFAIKLRAIAKGTTKVYLEYRRPWEKEVSPTKRMAIEVTVE